MIQPLSCYYCLNVIIAIAPYIQGCTSYLVEPSSLLLTLRKLKFFGKEVILSESLRGWSFGTITDQAGAGLNDAWTITKASAPFMEARCDDFIKGIRI